LCAQLLALISYIGTFRGIPARWYRAGANSQENRKRDDGLYPCTGSIRSCHIQEALNGVIAVLDQITLYIHFDLSLTFGSTTVPSMEYFIVTARRYKGLDLKPITGNETRISLQSAYSKAI
jgi:hypothetical protein